MKKLIAASSALLAVTMLPFSAGAAPKAGCPATSSGWKSGLVDGVAATIWKAVGNSQDVPDSFLKEIDGYDRNGDNEVCLVIRWDNLNPKSNWFGANLYIVADNNSNAAGS